MTTDKNKEDFRVAPIYIKHERNVFKQRQVTIEKQQRLGVVGA